MCVNGCLLNGMLPPKSCDTGKDPQAGTAYIVCTADCNSAWLAQNSNNGGQFHALEICKSLGYSQFGMWDGDCGDICGYCGQANSCNNLGKMMFSRSPQQPNCGTDQFGPIICNTVQWMCLR